jgi:hypothetical protein
MFFLPRKCQVDDDRNDTRTKDDETQYRIDILGRFERIDALADFEHRFSRRVAVNDDEFFIGSVIAKVPRKHQNRPGVRRDIFESESKNIVLFFKISDIGLQFLFVFVKPIILKETFLAE